MRHRKKTRFWSLSPKAYNTHHHHTSMTTAEYYSRKSSWIFMKSFLFCRLLLKRIFSFLWKKKYYNFSNRLKPIQIIIGNLNIENDPVLLLITTINKYMYIHAAGNTDTIETYKPIFFGIFCYNKFTLWVKSVFFLDLSQKEGNFIVLYF